MARPEEYYPEIQGLPSECSDGTQPYLRVDPLMVVVPYEDVDDISVEAEGIVSAESPPAYLSLISPLQDSWGDHGPGTLGWDSDEENDMMADMMVVAEQTVSMSAELPYQAAKIRSLALAALEILEDIGGVYDHFEHDLEYPLLSGLGAPYGLSVSDAQLGSIIDEENAGPWPAFRHAKREDIRHMWDHALSLLWCARFGVAQVESYAANETLFHEQGGGLSYETSSATPSRSTRTPSGGMAPQPMTPVDTWGERTPARPPDVGPTSVGPDSGLPSLDDVDLSEVSDTDDGPWTGATPRDDENDPDEPSTPRRGVETSKDAPARSGATNVLLWGGAATVLATVMLMRKR